MGAGGGGGNGYDTGGQQGGAGIYYKTITQPFSQPYSVGGGGGGSPGSNGGTGGATNMANFGTVNGGGGINGSSGNAPGASFDVTNSRLRISFVGNSGPGGSVWSGGDGVISIWENINT
jgi:hypothetical protein